MFIPEVSRRLLVVAALTIASAAMATNQSTAIAITNVTVIDGEHHS